MVKFTKHKSNPLYFPCGVCICQNGFHVKLVSDQNEVSILFYHRNEKDFFTKIDLCAEDKMGNVFSVFVTVDVDDAEDVKEYLAGMEYNFCDRRSVFPDPYGKSFSGRDTWGKTDQVYNIRRSPVVAAEFDWENDRRPGYALEDNVFYRMHARGFTKSPSSKVVQKGTFSGILEKKEYLKELGINAILLMPIQEFEEVILPKNQIQGPFGEVHPTGKLNYWGYDHALHFAPKASYSMRKHRDAVNECKTLIREMHKFGIEVFLEFFFDGSQSEDYVQEVLRYWVSEFHIDGVLLSGHFHLTPVAEDPYLVNTKILTEFEYGGGKSKNRHLASFQPAFLCDMRRILKGDEGMVQTLMYHLRSNPKHARRINYMADIKTMSMMDMVSYDIKHNEANGEQNADGVEFNYSWNCGVEGPSKKKKVQELRAKQLRNAFLMIFLSQGSPMIAMGDEVGQSRGGNNNAYCQDNEISWMNWKLVRTNNRLLEFVKFLIRFRKMHPTFRASSEPRLLDYMGIGKPDMSFHGIHVWQPSTEHHRRQLGVLYTGRYFKHADGREDESFYVLFNMHWEDHEFALPMTEKGKFWHRAIDTSDVQGNGFANPSEEVLLKNQRSIAVKARSIVVLMEKPAKE